jgi:hypothetical protein
MGKVAPYHSSNPADRTSTTISPTARPPADPSPEQAPWDRWEPEMRTLHQDGLDDGDSMIIHGRTTPSSLRYPPSEWKRTCGGADEGPPAEAR